MSSNVEEDYQNVLNTHARIMSILKKESSELKSLPQKQFVSERTPYYDAFQALSFEREELAPLVKSILNNNWESQKLESLVSEKVKQATSRLQQEEEKYRNEKFELRKLVSEQDRNLRNVHHNQNVPTNVIPEKTKETKTDNEEPEDQAASSTGTSLNARTQWQKVTGNAPLPKHLRHLLVNNLDQVEPSQHFLSIPFKPAIWKDILKSEHVELFQQAQENENEIKGNPADDLQAPTQVGPLRYWNSMSFKEFVRTIPWFSAFNNRQITLLESKIRIEKFSDSQVIIRQGEPLSFCMIRQGEVSVVQKESFNKPTNRVKRLFSGDLFGYELTTLEDSKHVDSSLSEYSYVASGEVTIYSCSSQTIRQVMFDDFAKEGDDGQTDILESDGSYIQYAEMGLCLDHDNFKLLNEHAEKSNNHYISVIKQLESFLELSDVSLTTKIKLKSRILPLCASEIEFRDMADEFISRIRNLFGVDRFGIYIVDRISNMMHLYTSHINIDEIENKANANTNGGGNSSSNNQGNVFKTITGIRMPLKGIAANVAQNNRLLNIEDCYKSVHFDSAMDIRTGYRSKQMLCLPIQDSTGQAVGVLQFINPLPSRKFTLCDEELAKLVASMVSPQVIEMQSKLINSHLPLPLHQFTSSVKLHVHRIESMLDNRHIKYTVRFVLNGKDIIPSRPSPSLYAMVPLPLNLNNKYKQMQAQQTSSSGDAAATSPWKCCDFNDYIDMLHLFWSDLQPGVVVIIEFFSKNNHPTGWTMFRLFNYKKVLQYGTGLELLLMSGGCPSDWNAASRMMAIHDLYQSYYKSGQDYHDHVFYTQLKHFFVGRVIIDILMKTNTTTPSSTKVSNAGAAGVNGADAVIVYEDRYPFTFVSYEQGSGMNTTNNNNDGKSGNDDEEEESEQLDPSLSSFLHRFGLPEAKRQQLVKYLYQFNYSLPWQEGVNTEMRELMWNYRDELLDEVPSSAMNPLLAMLNYTDNNKISWALAMLCKYRRRMKVISMIPMFDHGLSSCAKLQTFAVSALYHYVTKETYANATAANTAAATMMNTSMSTMVAGDSNRNNRIRMPLIENVLFFLLFILSGKEYRDSCLYRFFLFLVAQYPYSLGAMSFWYLRSFLQPDGRINITHSTAILMMKDVMKLLPNDLKVKLSNGWSFLSCLSRVYDEIFDEIEDNQQSSPSKRIPMIQFAHLMRDRLREEYVADTSTSQAVSIGDNSKPQANSHLTHEFCLPNHCDFHALERSKKASEDLKNKLAASGGGTVVGESLSRAKPEDSADFISVKDISVGGHTCKEGSFTIWCTTPTNFMGSLVFVPDLKWRSEFFMAQMIRMMNSIFISEGMDDIQCHFYECFSLGLPNRESVVTSHYKGAVALNTLLVEAIQYHNKVVKPPTTFTIRKNDQSMNKIPDDLLINYFEKNVAFRKLKQDADFIDDYLYSLGGYLISSHVLGLHGVGPINTMVTCDGELFVQSPSHILGVDTVSFYDRSYQKPKNELKRQPIFFLPCMAEAIGGTKHPFFKDLLEIVKHGFLCLRREAASLLWALKCLSSYLRFTPYMVETAFATLRETLMLDLTDVDAVRQLGDALNKGLNADYQLKLKR